MQAITLGEMKLQAVRVQHYIDGIPDAHLPQRPGHQTLQDGSSVLMQQVHLIQDKQANNLGQSHISHTFPRHHIPLLRSSHQHLQEMSRTSIKRCWPRFEEHAGSCPEEPLSYCFIPRLSAGCRVRIELLRNSLKTATNKPEDNHAMLPEMASEWETHKNLISYEATFPRHVGREWNTIEFYLKNFIYSGFTLMSHILGKHKYLIPISYTYCKAIKQHFKQKSTTIPNL